MIQVKDQLQRTITLADTPKRIISLVPSQTELLYDLGLDTEVVGITKFCIHPDDWFKHKTRVGGTKKYNFETIKALQPDLIIGNKEENEKEQIEELMKLYPVWMSDIKTLDEAKEMIELLGKLVQREEKAKNLIQKISASFEALKPITQKSCAYFIWKDPYLCAGKNTFIDDMMQRCGFKNIFSGPDRYPEISLVELAKAQPEVILLSSEPFPFKEKHMEELKEACPNAEIILVDGELFSWYGSRLAKSADYFSGLLH
jgi:ABC-type Fe3+-hydroxamate transport system substrate-binding protein